MTSTATIIANLQAEVSQLQAALSSTVEQRETLLSALKRAETVVDICSDWMPEIEMPEEGWTQVSCERDLISDAIAKVQS